MIGILELVKQCLGIVSTSTARDNELKMLIESAEADMVRNGVNIEAENNALIKNAIVTYVKAYFGGSNPDDKLKFLNSYQLIVDNLRNSRDYRG